MRALAAMISFVALDVAFAAHETGDTNLMNTIVVNGEGKATASPNMATIDMGVVTQGKSADEALKTNNEVTVKIQQVATRHHIADKDIQMVIFAFGPIYKPDRGSQQTDIAGYSVGNHIQIRIRNLADLGAVLDAVVQTGSNRIYGIRFDIDDPTGILSQVRIRAFQDAKRRAQVYSQAAGVRVANVRMIKEETEAVPTPLESGFSRIAAEGVPVAAGGQEFRVTVHVVFDLVAENGHAR
jgi:hypothetical protein